MSRPITIAPMSSPRSSVIGETESETSIVVPSLRIASVSISGTGGPPSATLACRTLERGRSSRRISFRNELPMISSAL